MKKVNPSVIIPLKYALFSLLWVVFSDKALYWLLDSRELSTKLGIIKGIAFIAITSLLIWYLIKEAEKKAIKNYEELTAVYEQLSATGEELRTQYEELIKNQEKIRYMAYYDDLTGLPNKSLFKDRLSLEICKASETNSGGAVLFIDLDDFKKINDSLGYDVGDELLKIASKKFKKCVNSYDTVARFGGDTFLILLPGESHYTVLSEKARVLLNEFKEEIKIDNNSLFATVSIGISVFPNDGLDANTIMKNAETALYQAKRKGRSTYCFFNDEMGSAISRRLRIENGLRSALKNNELYLCYQPQVESKTGRIKGLEALIRWKSPELGMVPAGEFIPIAEETGMIVEIGKWILESVCNQNKIWLSNGYNFDNISINISSIQLKQPDFLDTVNEILKASGVEPQKIEIEITETAFMESIEENINKLEGLKNMGIKISLDDFGTGYSSLNYLRRLPISTLKIDKSFIDNICENSSDRDITYGIIQLANKINLNVVAEGVEGKEQVDILKDMNCDIIQGYYFSKPIGSKEVEDVLKRGYFSI